MIKTIVRYAYQLAEGVLVRPTIRILLNLRDGTMHIDAQSVTAIVAAVLIIMMVMPRNPAAVNISEPDTHILEVSTVNR